MAKLSDTLTPTQAALRLGVSPQTVRDLGRRGVLPETRTPLGRLYDAGDVARVAAERAQHPSGQKTRADRALEAS